MGHLSSRGAGACCGRCGRLVSPNGHYGPAWSHDRTHQRLGHLLRRGWAVDYCSAALQRGASRRGALDGQRPEGPRCDGGWVLGHVSLAASRSDTRWLARGGGLRHLPRRALRRLRFFRQPPTLYLFRYRIYDVETMVARDPPHSQRVLLVTKRRISTETQVDVLPLGDDSYLAR